MGLIVTKRRGTSRREPVTTSPPGRGRSSGARDMRDGRLQQRMRRHQPLIVLNIAPAYERAEPETVIADGNIAEPG
jgi:hypothetical protein